MSSTVIAIIGLVLCTVLVALAWYRLRRDATVTQSAMALLKKQTKQAEAQERIVAEKRRRKAAHKIAAAAKENLKNAQSDTTDPADTFNKL